MKKTVLAGLSPKEIIFTNFYKQLKKYKKYNWQHKKS